MSAVPFPRTDLLLRSSELRAVRLFTVGIGVVAIVAMIAMAAEVAQPASFALPGTLLGAQFVLFLGAALAGALAGLMGLRTLRIVNGILVVLHILLLLFAWCLLITADVPLAGRQLSWMLIVIAIPVLSALIAWGPAGGWGAFAVLAALVAVLRVSVGAFTPNAVTNDVHTFSTAMVLCTLGAAVLTAARAADAAAQEARLAGIRAAIAAARYEVQMRAQLIVHDEVLAALGFAGRASAMMIAPLAAQARRAIELVRDLSAVRPAGSDAAPRRVSAALRALSAEHAAVFVEHGTAAFAPIPGAVVDAVLGAAHQALVNRSAHAPGSSARVELSWGEELLRVRVVDDGPGFDVERVSSQRMGIAVSILTRMRALAGGDASVRSAAGEGTEVRLEWRPDPPDDVSGHADLPPAVDPPLRDGALRVLSIVLLAVQLGLGAYDIGRTGEVLRPAVATATVVAALIIVTRWPARAAGVQAVILGALGIVGVGTIAWSATGEGPSYADYWPLTAHALALGLLCLRGRPAMAVSLALIEFTALFLLLSPGPYGQFAAGGVRAVSIVLVAAVLAGGLLRLRRRASRSQRRILEEAAAKAWQLAERDASHVNARRLQALVGGMLERIGEGRDLTTQEAAECRVLEGLLRDEYRGGRLAREPVVSAVADARRRGVDVVLIDDVPERVVDTSRLEAILDWVAEGVSGAETSFLGRMLPVGRAADVSAAIDGRATDFGG